MLILTDSKRRSTAIDATRAGANSTPRRPGTPRRPRARKGLEACPRSLLKRIISQAESEGLFPVFSQEFEWFNFSEDSKSLQDKAFTAPEPLTEEEMSYVMKLAVAYSAQGANEKLKNIKKTFYPRIKDDTRISEE